MSSLKIGDDEYGEAPSTNVFVIPENYGDHGMTSANVIDLAEAGESLRKSRLARQRRKAKK